jgi:hypothetical protein
MGIPPQEIPNFLCKEMVSIMTRDKTYDTPPENYANGGVSNNTSTSTPPPYYTPLNIERLFSDLVFHLPKGTIRK